MLIRVLSVVLLLCSALSQAAAEPVCKNGYGVTACGYDCVAEFGQVRCAQTPQGTCGSGYGKVRCWDPPPDVVSWMNYVRSPEPAQCIAALGQVACGFNCRSGYGQVHCAQTPVGACAAAYNQIRCWDPEPDVLWNMAYSDQILDAECITEYGQVACGYHCTAAYGKVRCAQSPLGSCIAQRGEILCWDPASSFAEPRRRRRP